MPARRSKGEGTVFQRHARDCRRKTGAATCTCPWYAQVDHGWIGGKRVRPARAATRDDGQRPTKQDAIRTRDAMLLEMRAGVITSASTMDQWLTYWLDNIIAHANLKPSTKTYYRQYAEQWLSPTLGKVRLDKLGPEHVRGLHAAMRDAGKSPTTIEWMLDEFGGRLLKITIPDQAITEDAELDWDDPDELRVYATSITEGLTTTPAIVARIPAQYIEVIR